MIYHGTSFNIEYIKTLSEEEFLRDINNHSLWPELSYDEKQFRLKELYSIIYPEIKAERATRKMVEIKNLRKSENEVIADYESRNEKIMAAGSYGLLIPKTEDSKSQNLLSNANGQSIIGSSPES